MILTNHHYKKNSQASPLFITLTQKPNQTLTVMKKEIYVYQIVSNLCCSK